MADIVNLRNARKRKARVEKEQVAAENRARFGRTRDERVTDRLDKELEQRRLDAHQRVRGVDDEPSGERDP